MQRATRYRFVGITLSLALGAFFALAACSDYGEGERCELANNNDDCASGLQCLPAASVNNSNSDRCCPVDRTTATHPACTIQTTVGGGNEAPDGDTGPEASPDTGTDSSTPVDSGNPGDANADADG